MNINALFVGLRVNLEEAQKRLHNLLGVSIQSKTGIFPALEPYRGIWAQQDLFEVSTKQENNTPRRELFQWHKI